MIHASTWQKLKKVLDKDKYLSFTLNYARRADGPQWHAILYNERNRILGRAMAVEADAAVLQMLERAARDPKESPTGTEK